MFGLGLIPILEGPFHLLIAVVFDILILTMIIWMLALMVRHDDAPGGWWAFYTLSGVNRRSSHRPSQEAYPFDLDGHDQHWLYRRVYLRVVVVAGTGIRDPSGITSWLVGSAPQMYPQVCVRMARA